VAKYMKMSKEEQRAFRAKMPDNQTPTYQEEPAWFGSSILPTIILPIAPFDIPRYDNGERWDLKAKYTGAPQDLYDDTAAAARPCVRKTRLICCIVQMKGMRTQTPM
jgi:hypothetical protein